jgi:hypothetical protein
VPQISSACTSPAPSGLAEHPTHRRCAYERHRPEETVLYKVLQAHWKTFLTDIESAAEHVRKHVRDQRLEAERIRVYD